MIKQDYLIRMIQEIISLIVNTILNKKKYKKKEWLEYDCLTKQILGFPTEQLISMSTQEIIDRYEGDSEKIGKMELGAMTMLKMSEEMESELILKSKLRQEGITLLKYVQKEDASYSLQRAQLIMFLEMNE